MVAVVAVAVILHVTRPDAPPPGHDCEPIAAGVLRQPDNAATSTVLIVVGLVLSGSAQSSRRLIGLGVFLAGTSSTVAHVTLHSVALAADGVAVVAALLLAALAVSRSSIRPWPATAAAFLGVGAITLWALSRSGRPLCVPEAFVNGHAVWHLLVALVALIGALSLTDRNDSAKPPTRSTLSDGHGSS